MSLLPRCSVSATSGTAATLAAISPALTGWTNAGAGVSGTAPATGDIVFIVGSIFRTVSPVSQTAGTGTWTFQTTGTDNANLPTASAWVAWRIFDGTETTPTFTIGTAGRQAWALVAVTPDSGSTVSIDVWATELVDAAATTHTPNAATAIGSGELSLILSNGFVSPTGVTSITITPPTGWTSLQTANEAGTSAQHVNATDIAYKSAVGSGSVAPGADAMSLSSTSIIDHVLVKQASSTSKSDTDTFTGHELSSVPSGVPTLVQAVGSIAGGAAATTAVITLGAGVYTRSGNVVVAWGRGSGNNITGVADTRGNTWNLDQAGTASSPSAGIVSAVITAPLGPGDQITVTFSASNTHECGAAEFANVATSAGSAVVDKTAVATNASTPVVVATAVNSAQGGDLVITAGAALSQIGTATAPATDPDSGGSWTDLALPGAGLGTDAAYQVGPGSPSLFSASWATGGASAAAIVAYAPLSTNTAKSGSDASGAGLDAGELMHVDDAQGFP